jgi:hypothetical protein
MPLDLAAYKRLNVCVKNKNREQWNHATYSGSHGRILWIAFLFAGCGGGSPEGQNGAMSGAAGTSSAASSPAAPASPAAGVQQGGMQR